MIRAKDRARISRPPGCHIPPRNGPRGTHPRGESNTVEARSPLSVDSGAPEPPAGRPSGPKCPIHPGDVSREARFEGGCRTKAGLLADDAARCDPPPARRRLRGDRAGGRDYHRGRSSVSCGRSGGIGRRSGFKIPNGAASSSLRIHATTNHYNRLQGMRSGQSERFMAPECGSLRHRHATTQDRWRADAANSKTDSLIKLTVYGLVFRAD